MSSAPPQKIIEYDIKDLDKKTVATMQTSPNITGKIVRAAFLLLWFLGSWINFRVAHLYRPIALSRVLAGYEPRLLFLFETGIYEG